MRLKIIRNELIKKVGKCQSCMVSKLRIIFKRTRSRSTMLAGLVDYMYCRVGLDVSVALVFTHPGAPTQYTIGSTRTRPAFRVRMQW